MEEDPFSQLLTRHFMKVTQCLENHKNFDILTRYSFSSSSDKAINHTENWIPELEYTQIEPEQRTASNLSMSTLDNSQSSVFKRETNAENLHKNNAECSSSSVGDSKDESKSGSFGGEYWNLSCENLKRKYFLKRPDTPVLDMCDFEESEVCSLKSLPPVRRIEASKKFIHSVSLPLLNNSVSSSEDQIVLSISNFDEIDDRTIESTICGSVQSTDFMKLDENQKTFEDELEEYKKEIKVEKAMKSLSVNDTIPHMRAKSRINISSCDSCSKAFRRGNRENEFRSPVFNDFSDHNRVYDIDAKIEVPPSIANTAEYLRYLLEESSTNVYHKLTDSKSSSDLGFLRQNNSETFQDQTAMDDDLIESVLTKFLKSQINNGKSNVSSFPGVHGFRKEVGGRTEIPSVEINSDTENYIKMNHLEIQKEMTRRIEDMYKAGDGN